MRSIGLETYVPNTHIIRTSYLVVASRSVCSLRSRMRPICHPPDYGSSALIAYWKHISEYRVAHVLFFEIATICHRSRANLLRSIAARSRIRFYSREDLSPYAKSGDSTARARIFCRLTAVTSSCKHFLLNVLTIMASLVNRYHDAITTKFPFI